MRDENVPADARLTGFEAQLSGLAPTARFDRDRLMFAAGGRAAAARSRHANRLLAGGNVLLAVALAALWLVPQPSRPATTQGIAKVTERVKAARQVDSSDGELPFVAVDGPTNLRLRQRLAADASIRWASEHTESEGGTRGRENTLPEALRVMPRRDLFELSGQL